MFLFGSWGLVQFLAGFCWPDITTFNLYLTSNLGAECLPLASLGQEFGLGVLGGDTTKWICICIFLSVFVSAFESVFVYVLLTTFVLVFVSVFLFVFVSVYVCAFVSF